MTDLSEDVSRDSSQMKRDRRSLKKNAPGYTRGAQTTIRNKRCGSAIGHPTADVHMPSSMESPASAGKLRLGPELDVSGFEALRFAGFLPAVLAAGFFFAAERLALFAPFDDEAFDFLAAFLAAGRFADFFAVFFAGFFAAFFAAFFALAMWTSLGSCDV